MKKVGVFCFSPTGSTRKVCSAIAEGIEGSVVEIIDLTSYKKKRSIYKRVY